MLRQMEKVHEQASHLPHDQSQQDPKQYDKSAGKPTFTSSPLPSYESRGQPNAKILTNMDELGHI